MQKYKTLFLVIIAATALIFSFPKTDQWMCVWVALVPLMFALNGKSFIKSFFIAYFCGFLFFAGTLYWFIHVTYIGAFCLIAYLSVYFGLFGVAYRIFYLRSPIVKIFCLPGVWVILEFARTHVLSGFGWASLGQSLYQHLAIIQIADITGMYGVSFLIVMGNVFLMEMLKRDIRIYQRIGIIVLTLVFVSGAYGYGHIKLKNQKQNATSKFVVGIVQANIPQDLKWEEAQWPAILEKYQDIINELVEYKPDLIVLPETSFPGFWGEDFELMQSVLEFVDSIDIPLLIGAVLVEDEKYYNAAILIDKDGRIAKIYRKYHLVPFGEYVPFRQQFPFLEKIVPIDDFTAGDEFTLFDIKDQEGAIHRFASLICFEDTVSYLGREFAQNGAQLFINMTNDGWFGDTKAPYMHLQSAVFRAIENRKGLIRVANTGLSCFIDQYGDLKQCVEDERERKTYTEGYAFEYAYFNDTQTIYSRFGDVFIYGCMIICFGMLFTRRQNKNK